jgi:hypothetical protein
MAAYVHRAALHCIGLAIARARPGPSLGGCQAQRAHVGLLVVAGCVALLVAACGSGSSTPSATPQQPDTPQGHLAPSGSPVPSTPDCPATPVAGPPHTLTLPASVDGYQRQDLQSYSELASYGQAGCNAAATAADYANSQLTVLSIDVGHHASLWSSGSSFWSLMWAGATPVAVPAGAQGGQVLCEDDAGFTCVWYDNDTFGNLTCPDTTNSQSQCLSLMDTFRAAIEQPG